MTGLPAYRTNKVCGMHFNLPQFFKMKNVVGQGQGRRGKPVCPPRFYLTR